ncbi:MAG: hypothetical protein V1672_04495 [Candidatus Diapherotrites archaeon]
MASRIRAIIRETNLTKAHFNAFHKFVTNAGEKLTGKGIPCRKNSSFQVIKGEHEFNNAAELKLLNTALPELEKHGFFVDNLPPGYMTNPSIVKRSLRPIWYESLNNWKNAGKAREKKKK